MNQPESLREFYVDHDLEWVGPGLAEIVDAEIVVEKVTQLDGAFGPIYRIEFTFDEERRTCITASATVASRLLAAEGAFPVQCMIVARNGHFDVV